MVVFSFALLLSSMESGAWAQDLSFLGSYGGMREEDAKKKAVLDFDLDPANRGLGLIRIKFKAQAEKDELFLGMSPYLFYGLLPWDVYLKLFESNEPVDDFSLRYRPVSLANQSPWHRIGNFPKYATTTIRARDFDEGRVVALTVQGEASEGTDASYHPTELKLILVPKGKGWGLSRIEFNLRVRGIWRNLMGLLGDPIFGPKSTRISSLHAVESGRGIGILHEGITGHTKNRVTDRKAIEDLVGNGCRNAFDP